MTAFINEFHYDNIGGDVGEFIEIAAPAGFDLTGWSLVLYNGSNGSVYNTISLTGISVLDAGAGFGFVSLSVTGLQNGSPDGIALVDDNGTVREFLSYEGIVTATDGPAAEMISVDIGVFEPGTTAIGQSLQRQGVGDGVNATAGDFVFAGPLGATPGAVNEGQSFGDVAPVLPSLVINEIHADPAGDLSGDANGDGTRNAAQDEFIEIVNTGDTDVDLSGVTLSDAILVRHTFADGTTLPAGQAIVVFGGGTPTGDFGGAQVVTASSGSLGLNNGGDTVTLATADGDAITEVVYGSEGGANQSLTRDPDGTGDLVQHSGATGSAGALFSPGTQVDGTAFNAEPPIPVLAINEIHADPASDLPGDANGDGVRDFSDDEFVEIVNTGDTDADLSGVTISDGVQVRHTFAEGTMLAPGAAIVVFGGGTPTGDFGGAQVVTASSGALGLNNGGDTVTIAAADATVIDQVVYGSEGGNNQSLTRDPDLTGDFTQHTDATGAEGALYSPGTSADGTAFIAPDPVFTINEVDADQTGTDSAEFIEIYDGGVGNASLDGLVVVLFNGSDDASYDAIDLSGQTTDENGFFVIGSESVPNVDLVAFSTNGVQNGADAVALYQGSADDFPNDTPATTANLIDAVVYDTNDADDSGLLALLGLTEQYNEDANGQKDTQSLSRVPDGSGGFVAQGPTPGETNGGPVDPPEPSVVKVSEIQGSSAGVTKVGTDDRSALEGQLITIQAIVTADFQATDSLGGFYVQEEDADNDADLSTSEGIFVTTFSLGATPVAVGDLVTVTGTVQEFFGETQVVATNVGVVSSNNALPTVTMVDLGAMGAIETDDADLNYVTNLEAYEGMLVEFTDTLTITEMFNLDRFGQYTVSDGRPEQFTQNNDPDVAGFDAHLRDVAAKSIVLDDGLTNQNPSELQIIDGNNGVLDAADSFRMGDTLDSISGVVAYGFDEFRIHDATGTYTQSNPRPETPEDVGGNFKVASLNVLNFFTTLDEGTNQTDTGLDPRGADSAAEFERQQEKAVAAILEIDADVLGLVEVENTNDSRAIQTLVNAVNTALGSEVYGFVNTGIVGGDAITNGLMYKLDSVNLVGEYAVLEEFGGRDFVDPLNAGRSLNRPAVAQTFEDADTGETFTIAVNHLKSKGSLSGLAADEAQGDGQGNNNATRTEAVDILAEWLASDPTGTGAEQQMIVGDLNSYAQEDPITTLESLGFTNVASDTDYSFVFDGQIGTLDYILINDALLDNFEGATEWKINADEADAIDYNLDFGRDPTLFDGETAARNSDHDPIIAGFTFDGPPINLVLGDDGRNVLVGTDGMDEIRSFGGSLDRMTGGADADVFVFGTETMNGVRERDVITDYEVGVDTILFEADVAILSMRQRGDTVILYLDADRDAIFVQGEGVTAENLTIEYSDDFMMV